MERHHVESGVAVSGRVGSLDEFAGLIGREGLRLRFVRPRGFDLGGVTLYQTIAHGLRERLVERHVDVPLPGSREATDGPESG